MPAKERTSKYKPWMEFRNLHRRNMHDLIGVWLTFPTTHCSSEFRTQRRWHLNSHVMVNSKLAYTDITTPDWLADCFSWSSLYVAIYVREGLLQRFTWTHTSMKEHVNQTSVKDWYMHTYFVDVLASLGTDFKKVHLKLLCQPLSTAGLNASPCAGQVHFVAKQDQVHILRSFLRR